MSNHLSQETSLYLKQHANNPVDWYPWSEETLELARSQDKPILLSIGYSACHWCHVMAHESFEDAETANIMNQHFINIKVDKEERPDLDKIYQQIHQLLNRQPGGWPLTLFLTPDKCIPFFSGTYFPKERRYGRISFKELLNVIAEFYHQKKQDVILETTNLEKALEFLESDGSKALAIHSVKELANQNWKTEFDPVNGGLGHAPKFPVPPLLNAILYLNASTSNGDPKLIELVLLSLKKMADGGIYDQLGGGFFRYSIDEAWEIPHFEKMLYDNAQLLSLYSNAYLLSHDPIFKTTIEQTIHWLKEALKTKDGGFYASINADSEGEEGKFYVWDPTEIAQYLDQDTFKLFAASYGLDQIPNFEGKWHLIHLKNALDNPSLRTARIQLKEIRDKRIQPSIDNKVLCAWNALLIKGLALAGMTLNEPDYVNEALALFQFLKHKLFYQDHLWVSFSQNILKQKGFLDDYAFVLDACWTLLQAKWDNEILKFSQLIAEQMIQQFWDEEKGTFYFTSIEHEELLYRPRTLSDEALPSGAAVAIVALQRFAYLLNNVKYRDITEKALKLVQHQLEKNPQYYPNLLIAQSDYLAFPAIVILHGKDNLVLEAKQCFQAYPSLRRFIFTLPQDAPPELQKYISKDELSIDICEGMTCQPPIKNMRDLERYLKGCDDVSPD